MKPKHWLYLALLAVAVALTFAPAFSQPYPPTFQDDDFYEPKRPPALFDHDEHMYAEGVEDCYTCHHYYEDGELIPEMSSEDMPCSDCHGLEGNGDQPNLMSAYHINCTDCHMARKAGPVTCGECHPRNLPAEDEDQD
jgi:cytochrome c553